MATWKLVGTAPAHITAAGFHSALGVWLNRPHLANKRLRHGTMLYSKKCRPEEAEEVVARWRESQKGERELEDDVDEDETTEMVVHIRQLTPKLDTPPLLEAVYIESNTHTATFLPLADSVDEKLPFFYPNLQGYRIRYIMGLTKEQSTIEVEVVGDEISSGQWVFEKLVGKLVSWGGMHEKGETSPPRVSLVDMDRFNATYMRLKKTYGQYLVDNWPECTDPQKFVFEDVALAAYLMSLWEDERAQTGKTEKQTFIDLGCGNGVLVWILCREGHRGKGVDVRARKIWELYGSDATLEVHTVMPSETASYGGYYWLVGNHSDELTPWVPIMAANGRCNYFVLPCCFFDLFGKFVRRSSNVPQYAEYLDYVQSIGTLCGYEVEVDRLRIPSTKRVCHVGRWRGQDGAEVIAAREAFVRDRRNIATEEFKARDAAIAIKNCTRLDRALLDSVVQRVLDALIPLCPHAPWRSGGKLPLATLVEMLGSETLAKLKSECGGLQTLLKNHSQLFIVQGGAVELRDWNKEASQDRPQKKAKINKKNVVNTKTKQCLFWVHHPDRCPRSASKCPFAHGIEDMLPYEGDRPAKG
eukprot:comp14183_c0_seq1/m.10127 comp14183_c0_seq1/g.10127  ORF comp14183_c0_seq1/g.10127 comp14183_c0_seq1/m.10127 type:complete len:585 (-) comp14183_c0_seq1:212-1966(-)